MSWALPVVAPRVSMEPSTIRNAGRKKGQYRTSVYLMGTLGLIQ